MHAETHTLPARPHSAQYEVLMLQALTACKAGATDEGTRLCRAVLANDPGYFDALFLSGVIAANKAELETAATFFTRATQADPASRTAHLHRAVTLQQLHRYAEALHSYDALTQIEPTMAEAHNNRGVMLYELGRFDEAVCSHARAIALNPASLEAHLNLGAALTRLERHDEALTSYRHCLALDPADPRALCNGAVALRALGHHEEALQYCVRALQLNPDDAQCLINLGNTLRDLQRQAEALLVYDRAIALHSAYTGDAFYNRGNLLKAMNRLEPALDSYAQALRLDSHFVPAHWNSALCRLLLGDFDGGWPGYEWRWQEQTGMSSPLATNRPRWTPGCGATRLLIWPEQGVGDEIMFGGLLSEARTLAPQLLVMLDARLIPLFSRSMPDIRFVPKSSPPDEDCYDAQLPIGSLCQYLRPDTAAFARTPHAYLHADPARSAQLRAALHTPGTRLYGISWRSGGLKTGAERSLALSTLVAAFEGQDVTLVNLQYGNVEAEIDAHNAAHPRPVQRSCVDLFNDIDGLAALICACDAVVSVDNTTVHLGGALGAPVSVLLPFHPDWRWQLNRSDSPWYPSLTLLRQHIPGNWAAPLQALRQYLSGEDHGR
jgi:tetratricopeptide (TPR) repeat protein